MHMTKHRQGLANFHFSSSNVHTMDECICSRKRHKIYTVAFQVFIYMYMYIVKNVVIPTNAFIFINDLLKKQQTQH